MQSAKLEDVPVVVKAGKKLYKNVFYRLALQLTPEEIKQAIEKRRAEYQKWSDDNWNNDHAFDGRLDE